MIATASTKNAADFARVLGIATTAHAAGEPAVARLAIDESHLVVLTGSDALVARLVAPTEAEVAQ